MGTSEGINRAMIATLSGDSPEYEGDAEFPHISNEVTAIVCVKAEIGYERDERFYVRFGGTPEECPEKYEQLNVLKLVNKDNPPILLINGRQDYDFLIDESALFEKTIRYFGNEAIWIVRENIRPTGELISFSGEYNPIDNFLDFYMEK